MSRKRKQEDHEGPRVSSSDSESDSDDDNTAIAPPVPHTDENEINSIVSKRLSSDNVDDASEAMESLRKLLGRVNNINAENNRKTAFRRGAHLAVVFAMRRHGNSSRIQYSGLCILVYISCCNLDNTSTKPDIIAVGGLKCCISAMQRHLITASVQDIGCRLIHNLWNRLDGDFQKIVLDEGGLKAVVNALDNQTQNQVVQCTGYRALRALFSPESSSSEAIVDAGCIDRVITAMNNHPNAADLQEYGCDILRCLATAKEDYRKMILQAKGLGPVVEALHIHNGNNKVKDAAQKALKIISA